MGHPKPLEVLIRVPEPAAAAAASITQLAGGAGTNGETEGSPVTAAAAAGQRAVGGQEAGVAEAAARLFDGKGSPPAAAAADLGHGTAGGAGDLHHAQSRASGTTAWQHPMMCTMAAVRLQCALRPDGMMYVLQQQLCWMKPFLAWRLIFLEKVGWMGDSWECEGAYFGSSCNRRAGIKGS